MLKTSQWIVDEGDLLLNESPFAIVNRLSLLKELWPYLREKRSLAACIRTLLAEIGYLIPTIYNVQGVAGIPSEIIYRTPRGLMLNELLSKVSSDGGSEEQDWGNATNDSLVTFLFSNAKADFAQELS